MVIPASLVARALENWPGTPYCLLSDYFDSAITGRKRGSRDVRLASWTKRQTCFPYQGCSVELKLSVKELQRRSAMLAQSGFYAFGFGIKEILDGPESLLPLGVCLHRGLLLRIACHCLICRDILRSAHRQPGDYDRPSAVVRRADFQASTKLAESFSHSPQSNSRLACGLHF